MVDANANVNVMRELSSARMHRIPDADRFLDVSLILMYSTP